MFYERRLIARIRALLHQHGTTVNETPRLYASTQVRPPRARLIGPVVPCRRWTGTPGNAPLAP